MITGNLQRRWSAERPQVYDKETRIVCLDIIRASQVDDEGNEQDGFSYIPVEIDHQIDYGHIKSQLIEAGFAQKDEFGLLMNAVENILVAMKSATSWASLKSNLDVNDINTFISFCDFRNECANAAHIVMNAY